MSRTALSPRHPFGLLSATDARAEGLERQLHRAHADGQLQRVRPGIYCPAVQWSALAPEDRYLAQITAVGMTLAEPVFGFESAAALLGAPLLRATRPVHLYIPENRRGRRDGIAMHSGGEIPTIQLNGLTLTTAARTAVDLARTRPHHEALAAVDGLLRIDPGLRSDLDDMLLAAEGTHGFARAQLVIPHADGRSDSFGESYSRSLMIRLGAPPPQLQTRFFDDQGLIGASDFHWPEYRTIAEFDGELKYGAGNPSGRSPENVVYREKLREDRLRRQCTTFLRFGWRDLKTPGRLAAMLRSAGIPIPIRRLG